jgi:hypothetical protein
MEITVIVPFGPPLRLWPERESEEKSSTLLEGGGFQSILLRRLIARMGEKAKQLNRYCAPVVLAVTIPELEPAGNSKTPGQELDLNRLVGALMTALPRMGPLSAVLLTFWHAQPCHTRSNIRLVHAYCVTRSTSTSEWPRMRVLMINPFATYGIGERETQALRAAL